MEHRLFPAGTVPHVSTSAFHADRERAPHLEQGVHRPRLDEACQLTLHAYIHERASVSAVDLGCGDGGLLQLLTNAGVPAHGYDFQPSNVDGWRERGVNAELLNFVVRPDKVRWAPIVVMTEVLEHMANPHGYLRDVVAKHSQYLVCSSPHTETIESHDACHAWAWDFEGYRALIEQADYEIHIQRAVGMFQVILAKRR